MAEEAEKDVAEKTEEPTQYRIDEFRKRGEVASSKELTSILVLTIAGATLFLSMIHLYETMESFFYWIYSIDFTAKITADYFTTVFKKTIGVALKCVAPVFIAVVCTVIISNILQIGILFSPDVLIWKLERVNPINGIKKLFSMRSLVEAIKGIFKFIFVMSVVYFFLRDDIVTYQGFYSMDFIQSFLIGKVMIAKLVGSIILSLLIVALGDFAYQKISYKNKLRMTKEQAKREHKEREGNPEIKQRIRTIQRDMATKRMMDDVKSADVVITNPTHISVALKFDIKTMISPQIVAKGSDHLALRIREVAKEHKIPTVENVPLARTLYKTAKLHSFIPRSLYQAVANVLKFVYTLKRKEKALESR